MVLKLMLFAITKNFAIERTKMVSVPSGFLKIVEDPSYPSYLH